MLPTNPNAKMDVVTTATHVLKAFEDLILLEMPNDKVVYDDELTFESGIKAYLAKNNFNDQPNTDYPVFIYNRSELKYPKVAPNRRLNNLQGTYVDASGNVARYKATQSEFEINFLYLCRSIEMQERFEVSYMGETGISANKVVTVNMPRIGKFNAYLTFGDLVGKKIIHEEAAYTAVMGQITARGLFFTFTGASKTGIIKTLNLQIFAKAGPPPDLNLRIGQKTITSQP